LSEKVVVIGSNSFTGSHFVDRLLSDGIECIGISRSQEPHDAFLPYKKRDKDKFQFYKLDLNHDLDEIMDVINENKAKYVVNFAAQGMVAESWEHPEHWFQTNVKATIKLHDELRKLDFLKKYVHVSTPEVYGNCEGLVEENTNYNPSTPYAVSRAAADMSLMSFINAYDFPVVFTRSANVFGPGQRLYRIIPRAILFFMIGRTLELDGGGHSVRSFIHIRDVAEGTFKVMLNGKAGEIFHLSSDRTVSIRELVELIAQLMGVSFDNCTKVVDERLGKDSSYLLDSSKAKKELGWNPAIDLEEGIQETIDWVTSNLHELRKQPFNYIHKR
jgi:dTDP-glucose 4,6-dehydratase